MITQTILKQFFCVTGVRVIGKVIPYIGAASKGWGLQNDPKSLFLGVQSWSPFVTM